VPEHRQVLEWKHGFENEMITCGPAQRNFLIAISIFIVKYLMCQRFCTTWVRLASWYIFGAEGRERFIDQGQ
jgi:hypothetical protein